MAVCTLKTEKICECKVKGCNSISPGHQQYHKPKGLLANEIKSGELRAVSLGPTCTHIYEGEMKTKQKPGEYRLIRAAQNNYYNIKTDFGVQVLYFLHFVTCKKMLLLLSIMTSLQTPQYIFHLIFSSSHVGVKQSSFFTQQI